MAYTPRRVALTGDVALLWRCATTDPTYPITPTEGVYRCGTFNDPVPILVENIGTTPVYLGTSAVTADTGWPLAKGQSLAFSVVGSDSLYAIGTSSVAVMVGRQRA